MSKPLASYRPQRKTQRDYPDYHVYLDAARGILSVEHDGKITWDELQDIKNRTWGASACAIEIYPPQDRVVNNCPMRHLWRLGANEWWPDLGYEGDEHAELNDLRSRFEAALRKV